MPVTEINKVSLSASKKSLRDKPSAEIRQKALEIAQQQIQQHYANQIEFIYRSEIDGLDEYLTNEEARIRDAIYANLDIDDNDKERAIATQLRQLKYSIWESGDFNGQKLDETLAADISDVTNIGNDALLTFLNDDPATPIYIHCGQVCVYDPNYFASGTNTAAHYGKLLAADPSQDTDIVLKMQTGNIEEDPNQLGEQTFEQIEQGAVEREHKFAKLYKYDGKTTLAIGGLGKLTLDPANPLASQVLGHRQNIQGKINKPIDAFFQIQALVPGIPLNDFIQEDPRFKAFTATQKISLAKQIVAAIKSYQEQTNAYHKDIRTNNIMIDMQENGEINVSCIDTGASFNQGVTTVTGLTKDDVTGQFYSHPEIVQQSKEANPEAFGHGTYTAVSVQYTDAHETYATRVTLQALGLGVHVPDTVAQCDMNDSLDKLDAELDTLQLRAAKTSDSIPQSVQTTGVKGLKKFWENQIQQHIVNQAKLKDIPPAPTPPGNTKRRKRSLPGD